MSSIENDGVKIVYSVIDESNGPYLLLHTGMNSTKEAWIELSYAKELKKHFKLVLIDPRGHGESDKPIDLSKYTFQLMAKDVILIMDVLDVDKFIFFGYSLGGLVGWVLAKLYPERLISLVNGGSRVKEPLFEYNPFLKRFPHLQDVEVENKDFELPLSNIEESLPNLTMPVLTFVGDKDQSCYPAVEEYSPLIPNCQTFTLEGLNHPEAITQKEKTLPRVLDFLLKVSRNV